SAPISSSWEMGGSAAIASGWNCVGDGEIGGPASASASCRSVSGGEVGGSAAITCGWNCVGSGEIGDSTAICSGWDSTGGGEMGDPAAASTSFQKTSRRRCPSAAIFPGLRIGGGEIHGPAMISSEGRSACGGGIDDPAEAFSG